MIKQKLALLFRSTLTIISPKLNTKVCYRVKFHKKLDLKNPKTLNEKNLWLKLNMYGNDQLVRKCADKYRVREYVSQCGCSELLNDLIAVYDDPMKIKWEILPKKFAMKLNVGSGANMICKDKSQLNMEEMNLLLKKWFKKKFYLGYSEMQYKNIKPYVLFEKYINDGLGNLPVDYKFYCFKGRAEYVMLCLGREKGYPDFVFYDRNWNFVPFEVQEDPNIEMPEVMKKAFDYADKLSEPFPYVRTDLYIVGEKIIFGELTFTSCAGMDFSITREADEIMGARIVLPQK